MKENPVLFSVFRPNSSRPKIPNNETRLLTTNFVGCVRMIMHRARKLVILRVIHSVSSGRDCRT